MDFSKSTIQEMSDFSIRRLIPGYGRHLLVYIDILGFKDALRDKQSERDALYKKMAASNVDPTVHQDLVQAQDARWAIHRTLVSISELVGEYKITQNESGSVNIRPTVSIFSDHLVISYPLEDEQLNKGGLNSNDLLFQLSGIIGDIFQKTIGAQLLMRGAIMIGELYHKAGIIFGPALIEAYLLESKKAHHPRLIFSDECFNSYPWNTQTKEAWASTSDFLFVDHDGCLCLDYVKFVPQEQNKWWEGIQHIISKNISYLKRANKSKEASHWQWFADRVNHYLSAENIAH